jgi:hypothetical protein
VEQLLTSTPSLAALQLLDFSANGERTSREKPSDPESPQ